MGFGNFSNQGGYDNRSTRLAYDNKTGKRVKTNLTSGAVAHVWAQRSQDFGQNGRGSFYFDGDKLYSYGSHFLVAQFVTGHKGKLGVILNSDSYSPSTGSHQSYARDAIDSDKYEIFRAPGAYMDHIHTPRYYAEKATEYAAKAKRCRNEWSIGHNLERAHSLLAERARYIKFFNLSDGPAPNLDALVEASESVLKAAKAREKERAAKARATQAEAFAEWQSGAAQYAPSAYHRDSTGSAYCRIKGEALETSLGASVPLEHAIKVFRLIERVRASGVDWTPKAGPLRVGHYQVDRIESSGDFKAGCHKFSWRRVEEAARLAGLLAPVLENA